MFFVENHPMLPTLLCSNSVISTSIRDIDKREEDILDWYSSQGCSCSLGPDGSPCFAQFSRDHYATMREDCAQLTREEKDILIMGQIMAMSNTSTLTRHSSHHRHTPQERKRSRAAYFHQGNRVCLRTFLFLHYTKKDQFLNIKASCSENGIAPRVHGNTRRLPVHALTFDDVSRVVTFIRNYAEDHAVLLPGRIPGYKRSDLQLLPCSTTRASIWREYSNACDLSHHRSVAYSTFCETWRTLLPMILPARPRTDLCPVCHAKAGLLMRSSNLSEGEKSQVITRFMLMVLCIFCKRL